MGTPSAPAFKLHGGETISFLHFAGWLIEQYGARLPQREVFARAQKALVRIKALITENPVVFTPEQCEDWAPAASHPPPPREPGTSVCVCVCARACMRVRACVCVRACLCVCA
eukprot:5654253-Alexandrium_andersonii.AAC.1